MTFSVQSEAGQLRQVIVHRPGLELSRLTPRNVGELLFDDVLWAKKAKEEHDAFAEALREKGVRVHYFGQLLGETLELPDRMAEVNAMLDVASPAMREALLIAIAKARQWIDDLAHGRAASFATAPARALGRDVAAGPGTRKRAEGGHEGVPRVGQRELVLDRVASRDQPQAV